MVANDVCGTVSVGDTTLVQEDAHTQVVATPGNTRAVRDVVVSSRGSLDSGLAIARYDDDENDASSDSASSGGSAGSVAPWSSEGSSGSEMVVADITITDGSANIGIFKNYVNVFMCEGKGEQLTGFPGAEGLPTSALKNAQVKVQAAAPVPAGPCALQDTDKKGREVDQTAKCRGPVDACWNNLNKVLRWPWSIVPSAAVSVAILVVIYFTLLSPPQSNSSDPTDPIILPNGIQYASRKVWKAVPPKRKMPGLTLPSTAVIIHHTATSACYTTKVCIDMVAAMQRYQMDVEGARRDWADIGYNFLVGGDGVVYEGRGWEHAGGHFEKEIWSPQTVGIAVIGDFTETLPPENQLQQLRKFVAWATTVGKVASDYKLYGVCQLKATKSPGLLLMARLRTWPHWDSFVAKPNVSCTE